LDKFSKFLISNVEEIRLKFLIDNIVFYNFDIVDYFSKTCYHTFVGGKGLWNKSVGLVCGCHSRHHAEVNSISLVVNMAIALFCSVFGYISQSLIIATPLILYFLYSLANRRDRSDVSLCPLKTSTIALCEFMFWMFLSFWVKFHNSQSRYLKSVYCAISSGRVF